MTRPLVVCAVALLGTVLFTGACGDSAHNNEGPCTMQASVDPASGCDSAKASYYTCPGARQPDVDGGVACTFSKVAGGFCCPLPTAVGNGSQTGRIVDLLNSTSGIPGATIDFGDGVSTTTDATGNYSLQIVQNKPFFMTVSAPSYTTLLDQEWFLTGDADNGTTSLVSAAINAALSSGFPGYDATKVNLGIGVYFNDGDIYKQGNCKDNAGAVVNVDPPTAGVLVYFGAQHTPAPAGTTSVQSGATNPSALLYNIDPNAPPPKITVTPPAGCTVSAYPHTVGNITYTGNYKLLPSGVAGQAFFRDFLE